MGLELVVVEGGGRKSLVLYVHIIIITKQSNMYGINQFLVYKLNLINIILILGNTS